MKDYDKTTLEEIKELHESLQVLIEDNGHLDHMVRAVEDYMYTKNYAEYKHKMTRLNKRRAEAERNSEADVYAETLPPVPFYRIIKQQSENLDAGRGCVYHFGYGAQIMYSSEGTNLDKHIAVAHELAHILLHPGVASSKTLKNKVLETQASFFAKLTILSRSKQYRSQDFISDHIYEQSTVDSVIKHVHPDYDESLMASRTRCSSLKP